MRMALPFTGVIRTWVGVGWPYLQEQNIGHSLNAIEGTDAQPYSQLLCALKVMF